MTQKFLVCIFKTLSGLYLFLQSKSVSFTLKVGSRSCGSGLDGTENEMSWADTFSSFCQRTKDKNKNASYLLKQIPCNVPFTDKDISLQNLLQFLSSHSLWVFFFPPIGKPPFLQHGYSAQTGVTNSIPLLTNSYK